MIEDRDIHNFVKYGCLIAGVIFLIPLILWGLIWMYATPFGNSFSFPKSLAELGDAYGVANAIVSGLGLGALLVTLVLQRHDLKLSIDEMAGTREGTERLAASQEAANTIHLWELWHQTGDGLRSQSQEFSTEITSISNSVHWNIAYYQRLRLRRMVTEKINGEEFEQETVIASLDFWTNSTLKTWLLYESRRDHDDLVKMLRYLSKFLELFVTLEMSKPTGLSRSHRQLEKVLESKQEINLRSLSQLIALGLRDVYVWYETLVEIDERIEPEAWMQLD